MTEYGLPSERWIAGPCKALVPGVYGPFETDEKARAFIREAYRQGYEWQAWGGHAGRTHIGYGYNTTTCYRLTDTKNIHYDDYEHYQKQGDDIQPWEPEGEKHPSKSPAAQINMVTDMVDAGLLEVTSQPDPEVDAPSHYDKDGKQVWDTMKDLSTEEEYVGYLKLNVIKYLSRYKDKGGKQSLEKARAYINKLIETEYGNEN